MALTSRIVRIGGVTDSRSNRFLKGGVPFLIHPERRAIVSFEGGGFRRMDKRSALGKNDIDDVRWLCSLSDSEIDLLMGLKSMVIMRAQQIGHEELAKNFDLRMLHTLGSLFMEHLKGQLKAVPGASTVDCNISKQKICDTFSKMSMEELYPYICIDAKKRIADMFPDDVPPSKKRKMEE